MSDLTLRINADFDKASKAFNDLANTSEETRKKIENFSDTFKDKTIDSFIDKQKLLTASLTGTRGEVDAMKVASSNYQKEIERLVRSGLDPQSEAIQRLVSEKDKLAKKIKEVEEAQKMQENAIKAAEKAFLACTAAIAAGFAAIAAMTQRTAEMGDQFAKTSRMVGITAETFQELNYAAKQSGIKNLTPHLQRLNRTVIDVRNGTGQLTKFLQDNNKELLNHLQNVNSNEEAFNLLMDEIARAPDELTKAEIATAAFGRAGQEMVLMAQNGTKGIAELREEARKYGVMSNDAARASEEFLDAQTRLKASLTGVQMELTTKLMPSVTDATNKIADFIASIDNWDEILRIVGTSLGAATAGLGTFILVSKGATYVKAMATAIKTLMVAITGPAGIAA